MADPRNILVLTYWSYKDALIQTYTLPYVKQIKEELEPDSKIYLVCLEQQKYQMTAEEHREEKRKLKAHNIELVQFRYSNFGFFMFFKTCFILCSLLTKIVTKRINYIHSWCTPAGSLGYILSILTRRKLVLDSYEPHAEPMVESNTWKRNSIKFRLLFWLEKAQLRRATEVITCVPAMNDYVRKTFNIELRDTFSKPACVDFELFNEQKLKDPKLLDELDLKDKVVGIYTGKFGGSYLKEELFEFIKVAEDHWGKDKFRFIILSGHPAEEVAALANKAGIALETILHKFVPHKEVATYMRLANFGLVPFLPVPSKRYGSPIKTNEYFAMGLPVVITKDISDDSNVIAERKFGYVLEELNTTAYSNACKTVEVLISDQNKSIEIIEYAKEFRSFDCSKEVYHSVYQRLMQEQRNILALTYWSYNDALVQTYTLPYVRIIKKNLSRKSKIYLLTLEQKFYRTNKKEWRAEKAKLANEGIHLIRFRYSRFGIKMFLKVFLILSTLIGTILRKRIKTIHAWCTTAGALGYTLSVLTRRELIIDSYEPHAEAMVENGTWKRSSIRFRLLYWLEKKQSKRAKTVIALTKRMKDYAIEKYNARFDRCFIKPALVDMEQFSWSKEKYVSNRESFNVKDNIVCVYTGKIGGIYLEEEFFDFFKVASDFWGEKLKLFMLTNSDPDLILEYMTAKDIPESNVIITYVDHEEVNKYLTMADFAVNFVKPLPSKRYCTSIKDGEYWAMGLPVVITPNISDDSGIIASNEIGSVLEGLDKESYEKAIREMDQLLTNIDKSVIHNKIRPVANRYRNFEIAHEIYEEIYGNKTTP